MLRARQIQAKLGVSDPQDELEQEADQIADHVMRMPDTQSPAVATARPLVQRKCSECDEELHRSEESSDSLPTIDPATENSIASLSARGNPLSQAVRSFMEPRFKADFSSVRVHTDARAHELARSVNAKAFTIGHNVVFGAGQYEPESDSGKRLLAHELTHVVQQSAGNTSAAQSVVARAPGDMRAPPVRSDGLTPAEWTEIRKARAFFKLPPEPTESQSTIVGVLITDSGEKIYLKSGEEGGPSGGAQRGGVPRGRGEAYTQGGASQGNIATHVEGHAAATMHQRKLTRATLLIEAPPCQMCDNPHGTPNITRALPPGSKLTIVDPQTTGHYWSSQRAAASSPAPPSASNAGSREHMEEPAAPETPTAKVRAPTVEGEPPVSAPPRLSPGMRVRNGVIRVGGMLLFDIIMDLVNAKIAEWLDERKFNEKMIELQPEIDRAKAEALRNFRSNTYTKGETRPIFYNITLRIVVTSTTVIAAGHAIVITGFPTPSIQRVGIGLADLRIASAPETNVHVPSISEGATGGVIQSARAQTVTYSEPVQ